MGIWGKKAEEIGESWKNLPGNTECQSKLSGVTHVGLTPPVGDKGRLGVWRSKISRSGRLAVRIFRGWDISRSGHFPVCIYFWSLWLDQQFLLVNVWSILRLNMLNFGLYIFIINIQYIFKIICIFFIYIMLYRLGSIKVYKIRLYIFKILNIAF